METNIKADSQFQAFLKHFRTAQGEKQKEFCQWLLEDAEGLTLEEQVVYKTYLVVHNLIEYEELKNKMRWNIWKPDPDEAMKLIEAYP